MTPPPLPTKKCLVCYHDRPYEGDCPHCRKSRSVAGKVAFIIFGIAIIWVMVSIDHSTPPPVTEAATATAQAPTPAPTPPEPRCSAEMLDYDGHHDGGGVTVEGRIRNSGNKTCRYVEVTFSLYSRRAELVGHAVANITGLGAGAVWRFKAYGFEGDAYRFDLDSVNAF
jgi:hypothetical protein